MRFVYDRFVNNRTVAKEVTKNKNSNLSAAMAPTSGDSTKKQTKYWLSIASDFFVFHFFFKNSFQKGNDIEP